MLISLISIFGLILRLVHLNQSFWLDEGASFGIASQTYSNLISGSVADFHPPFFYIILKLWLNLVGHSNEIIIRLPFVILSSLSVYLVYTISKEIFGTKNRFLLYFPSLLLAINPFHIYYSQELRMYSINTIFSLLSWLYLLKVINNHKGKQKPPFKNHFLFVIFTSLNLYTFYGAFFNLAAQLFYTIFTQKNIKKVFILTLVSLLLFVPWVPTLVKQMQGSGVLSNLSGWKEISGMLSLKDLLLIPTKFLLGRISFEPKKIYYFISISTIFYTVYLSFKSKNNQKTIPIFFALIIPLIIASLISLKTPVLGYWRYLFLLPYFLILISAGISQLNKANRTLASTFFILLFFISNLYFWTNPQFHREDWQGLSSQMNTDKTLIVFNFTGAFAPLSYYLPNANYYPTQTHLGQVNQVKLDDLVNITNNYIHIYYLDYLSDLTDPDRKTLKYLKDLNLKQVQEKSFNGIGRLIEFEVVK